MKIVVQLENVTKVYPGKGSFFEKLLGVKVRKNGKMAIENLNVTIHKGEIYGLLGPNGAGKTTFIRMVAGILRPDSGSLAILGKDIFKNERLIKSKLGVVLGGDRSLYWKLTGYENLEFFAALYGLTGHNVRNEIERVLQYVNLLDRKDDYVEEYSKGMKQRLLIAKSLLHHPEVLLLDEPTVGLDVESSAELRKLLQQLNQDLGVTIILTTHYLYEAEQLCNRIGILKSGQIIKEGSPAELKSLVSDMNVVEIKIKKCDRTLSAMLTGLDYVKRVEKTGFDNETMAEMYEIGYVESNGSEFGTILKRIIEVTPIISIEQKIPTLEDVFLKLTKEGCISS